MAKLTPEQQKTLDELNELANAPDENGKGRELSVFVDLSDDNAVQRALKLGLLEKGDLTEFDADDDAADDEDGDDDEDGGGDGKGRRRAAAPRRRLNMADRMMGGGNADE